MHPLRLPSGSNGELEVLCLGAHCDDIEIGCGGTLIDLVRARPLLRIRYVVFTSDDVRAAEARDAARRIAGDSVALEILDFRNGYFPFEGAEIKDYFENLKRRVNPDLIFTHWLSDRHQDHRIIAELTWNTFRDHLILEYEIPKYEGDLGRPNLLVPLSEGAIQKKVATIRDSFASQRDKLWFTESTFFAMSRLRGIECNAPSGYAEAFHGGKVALSLD